MGDTQNRFGCRGCDAPVWKPLPIFKGWEKGYHFLGNFLEIYRPIFQNMNIQKFWFSHENRPMFRARGGGTHMPEVHVYVPLWQPPFSCSSTTPEFHLFTPSVISYALCFLLFLKNSAFLGPFLSDISKISAPNTIIFVKIVLKTLVCKEKSPFCRP